VKDGGLETNARLLSGHLFCMRNGERAGRKGMAKGARGGSPQLNRIGSIENCASGKNGVIMADSFGGATRSKEVPQ